MRLTLLVPLSVTMEGPLRVIPQAVIIRFRHNRILTAGCPHHNGDIFHTQSVQEIRCSKFLEYSRGIYAYV